MSSNRNYIKIRVHETVSMNEEEKGKTRHQRDLEEFLSPYFH